MAVATNVHAFIRKLVFEECGIVLDADKDYYIEARLARVANRFGLPTILELTQLLRGMQCGRFWPRSGKCCVPAATSSSVPLNRPST